MLAKKSWKQLLIVLLVTVLMVREIPFTVKADEFTNEAAVEVQEDAEASKKEQISEEITVEVKEEAPAENIVEEKVQEEVPAEEPQKAEVIAEVPSEEKKEEEKIEIAEIKIEEAPILEEKKEEAVIEVAVEEKKEEAVAEIVEEKAAVVETPAPMKLMSVAPVQEAPAVETFKVTWKDEDGTVLTVTEVEKGQIAEYPYELPSKEATAQYTYSFKAWSPKLAAVTSNKTYKATYTQTAKKYNVTVYFDNIRNTNGTVVTKMNPVQSVSANSSWSFTQKKLDNQIPSKDFSVGGVRYIYTGSWQYADGTAFVPPMTVKGSELSGDVEIHISPIYEEIRQAHLDYRYIDNISTGSGSWYNVDSCTTFSHTFKQPEGQPHYQFVEWLCQDGTSYQQGETFHINFADLSGDTTILTYAMWQPSVTVNYYKNSTLLKSVENFEGIELYAYEAEDEDVNCFAGWYDADGNRISEDQIYAAPAVTSAANSAITINVYARYLTSRSVLKVWDDADDQDGYRTDSVRVQLTANGQALAEEELNEDNHWFHKFEGLAAYDENGRLIDYQIDEISEVAEYSKSAAQNEEDLTNTVITNSHTPEEIEVLIRKVWNDSDNKDGIRPLSILVHLLANGEEIAEAELNEESDWTYSFSDLAKNQAGNEIEYTIEETSSEGYRSEIRGNHKEGFVITNSHDAHASYTVNYYQQNEDGSYGLQSSESYKVLADEEVTVEAKEFEGFTFNEEKSQLGGIALLDDSLVLNLYYDREVEEVIDIEEPIVTPEPIVEEETPVIVIEEPTETPEPVVTPEPIEEEAPVIVEEETPAAEEAPVIVEEAPVREEAPYIAPAIINNTPAAPSAPVEEVLIEEVIENELPLAEPEMNEVNEEIVEIEEAEMPLAEYEGSWALINLLCTIGSILVALLMIITAYRKEEDEEEEDEERRSFRSRKLLGILPALASLIIFLLTENMANPMVLTDRWTLLMVLILVVSLLAAFLTRNKDNDEEEKEVVAA